MESRLLTTAEAADLLRLSPYTLERWRSRGQGPPFIRLGDGPSSAVRYREADLLAWQESRVRTPSESAAAVLSSV